uniref:KIB1-4 beta-propeller domain-containing protein n=1 Tax=Leersia perrieri TaxID=77586 RepID=A0A0D9V1P6_9ORYZ
MDGSMDWASLQADLPKDFVHFRAVCLQWRAAVRHTEHAFFQPWIMASRWLEEEYSEDVLFYSLATEKTIKVCIPGMKVKRIAASGSGHLVAVDKDDDLSAVLVNPLTGKTTALPRLPEFFHHNGAHGWVTGEGAITVMLSNWLSGSAALWYRGGDITIESWAIVPQRKLRSRMPYYLQMLAAHGDQMHMHLTELSGDNNDTIAPQQFMQKVQVLGACRPESDKLFRATTPYHHKWFSLYRIVGQEDVLVHDIDDAILVQSRSNCGHTYMFPGSRDFATLDSGNAFYYLGKQFHHGDTYDVLYKKCLANEQLTVAKRLPEDWKFDDDWFMPTLKY